MFVLHGKRRIKKWRYLSCIEVNGAECKTQENYNSLVSLKQLALLIKTHPGKQSHAYAGGLLVLLSP